MSSKLLDNVREVARLKYLSPRTENAYVQLLTSIARNLQKVISYLS